MHRGFNLKPKNKNAFDLYFKVGEDFYKKMEKKVRQSLDQYISPDGSIDGSKMQEDWFPLIKTDIFISHSHKDKDFAIALAGWLLKSFGLTTFIDSCIWGYSEDLLKMIDDEFCWNKSNGTYNYIDRNYSTSHVHMMLSTALNKMMDKTECIFFINTENSITPKDLIEQTESPWIYSEITMTQLLKERRTGRESKELLKSEITKLMSEHALLEKFPAVKYKADLDNLTPIDESILYRWHETFGFCKKIGNKEIHPLDVFYKQNPPKKSKLLI